MFRAKSSSNRACERAMNSSARTARLVVGWSSSSSEISSGSSSSEISSGSSTWRGSSSSSVVVETWSAVGGLNGGSSVTTGVLEKDNFKVFRVERYNFKKMLSIVKRDNWKKKVFRGKIGELEKRCLEGK